MRLHPNLSDFEWLLVLTAIQNEKTERERRAQIVMVPPSQLNINALEILIEKVKEAIDRGN